MTEERIVVDPCDMCMRDEWINYDCLFLEEQRGTCCIHIKARLLCIRCLETQEVWEAMSEGIL